MARGQTQAADTTRNQVTGIGNQQLGQAGKLESSLIPAYTSLMDTGFFNPEEEAAQRNDIMGAAEAPFATAGFEAANRAGATRNAADLTAQQDELALEKGRTSFEAANKVEEDKLRNQLAGTYGLENLFGENLKAGEAMYGLTPGLLQARAAGQSGDQTALGYLNWAVPGKG